MSIESKVHWTHWYKPNVLCIQGMSDFYVNGHIITNKFISILKTKDKDIFGLYFSYKSNMDDEGCIDMKFIPVLDDEGKHVLIKGVKDVDIKETIHAIGYVEYPKSNPRCLVEYIDDFNKYLI